VFFASAQVLVQSRFDVLKMSSFFNLLDINKAAACNLACHFGRSFASAVFCWLLLASVWSLRGFVSTSMRLLLSTVSSAVGVHQKDSELGFDTCILLPVARFL
jgi:hypothetical protein